MLWSVVEVHFVLPVGVVSTQHRLLKRSLSSVGSLVHLRQQPGAHVCVVLLLGPRGRPGAVCLSPPGSTQSRLLKSESEISDSSPFTLLKIVLAVLVPLPFLIRFRMHLSVSTKVSPGLLLKFHSACRSVLGEATPLPCRLPAPEWGRLRPDADWCLPAAFMIQRTRPRHDFTFPSLLSGDCGGCYSRAVRIRFALPRGPGRPGLQGWRRESTCPCLTPCLGGGISVKFHVNCGLVRVLYQVLSVPDC